MTETVKDDFYLETDEGAYDPFEDFDIIQDDEEATPDEEIPTAVYAVDDTETSAPEPEPAPDTRPASERIADLFDEMAPRKRVMLAILDYLRDVHSAPELADKVDELQTYDHSVYTSTNYCTMLEGAGAIVRVGEDGQPVDETIRRTPEHVIIDGVEYLKPLPPRTLYWITSPDGIDELEKNDPAAALQKLLADKPENATLYKKILLMGDADEGTTIKAVDDFADEVGRARHTTLYGANYIDDLETCGAIRWSGAWRTTDLGRQAIEQLADVSVETATTQESEA